MKKHYNIFLIALIFSLSLFIAGCSDSEKKSTAETGAKSKTVLKVGATSGPQAQILEAVKPLLEKEDIDLQIIEFNDFTTPNLALDQGDLDANSMQHQPFLDAQIAARNFKLVPLGKTVLMPMGVYSKKVKNLDELKEGSTVAIPNDPSNGGRALLLLQTLNIIKLNPDAGILPSPADIIENPKKLQFKEVEAAQAPRILDDVDLVAINTNYALVANLDPKNGSLGLEDKNSPYACVIVARESDKNREDLQKLVKAYQSAEVEKFIDGEFKGSIIKAW